MRGLMCALITGRDPLSMSPAPSVTTPSVTPGAAGREWVACRNGLLGHCRASDPGRPSGNCISQKLSFPGRKHIKCETPALLPEMSNQGLVA